MTTTHQGQPSPKEIVAKMIALHSELGNFQTYLAYQSIPPHWEGEEYEAISKVCTALGREIKRMQLLIKDRALDDMVRESLRNAGFEPDAPGEDGVK